jgi:hypothetical protein
MSKFGQKEYDAWLSGLPGLQKMDHWQRSIVVCACTECGQPAGQWCEDRVTARNCMIHQIRCYALLDYRDKEREQGIPTKPMWD